MTERSPSGLVLPKPVCAACGHDLSDAVNSASCPGCGRPLVEVLVRPAMVPMLLSGRRMLARRYQSERRVLGMPLVAIATGIGEDGKPGHAKGVFAFGDIATGVFAFGGLARGVVAFGGASFGGVTFGGLSLGTFAAFGGLAIAWLGSAVGGFAAGILAAGGGAIGLVAQGGLAIGWLARGAQAKGVHTWSRGATAPDTATQSLFDQYAWLVGPSGPMPQIHYNLIWTVAIGLAVMLLALTPLFLARTKRDPIAEELRR
ncbi:MAG: hypothetical protein RLZZ116_1914 [Planctomycetota bacterium]|jgi:hypothetical protein